MLALSVCCVSLALINSATAIPHQLQYDSSKLKIIHAIVVINPWQDNNCWYSYNKIQLRKPAQMAKYLPTVAQHVLWLVTTTGIRHASARSSALLAVSVLVELWNSVKKSVWNPIAVLVSFMYPTNQEYILNKLYAHPSHNADGLYISVAVMISFFISWACVIKPQYTSIGLARSEQTCPNSKIQKSCPLTCDNYKNRPQFCTTQCVRLILSFWSCGT